MAEKDSPKIAAARAQTEQTPDAPVAHFMLGVQLGDSGRNAEALEAFGRATELLPDYAMAHANRGVVLMNLGRHEEALEALGQAIKLKPEYAPAHANRGLALVNLGRNEEALEDFKQAIKLQMDDAGYALAHSYSGIALERLGRREEALEALRRAIKLKPDDATAHNNLAYTLSRFDRPDEAHEHALRAVELDSEDWYAWATMGTVYIDLGDRYLDDDYYDDAVESFRQAVKFMPDAAKEKESRNVALTYLQRGYAFAKLGDHGKASADFKTCMVETHVNSRLFLAARRNLKVLKRRRGLQPPRWLPYILSPIALGMIGLSFFLLIEDELESTAFVTLVLALFATIFIAFSLPTLTRLKLGVAEMEKEAGGQIASIKGLNMLK